MKNDFAKQFVKDRNEAFISLVETDKLDKVIAYLKKYKMIIYPDKVILKASIYKAIQECTDIPDDIKKKARQKCVALGFNPYFM